jgi:NAD(P)-dependent dehydrogenase (short-subunit alcohol dehydrogenase family)
MTNRIITPFDAKATADDVSAGIDLTGRRAVVTGGASGIGVETSKTLARRGASLVLAVRNIEAGKRVAAEITAETGNPEIDVRPLELTDRDSVRSFVENWSGPLDLLINNAGVMAIQDRTLNDAGWETQFATNFLGHFALTVGLRKSLAEADGARVVAVSSSAHLSHPSFSTTSTSGTARTTRRRHMDNQRPRSSCSASPHRTAGRTTGSRSIP